MTGPNDHTAEPVLELDRAISESREAERWALAADDEEWFFLEAAYRSLDTETWPV